MTRSSISPRDARIARSSRRIPRRGEIQDPFLQDRFRQSGHHQRLAHAARRPSGLCLKTRGAPPRRTSQPVPRVARARARATLRSRCAPGRPARSPAGLGSAAAPSGMRACRRFTSGMSMPRSLNRDSIAGPARPRPRPAGPRGRLPPRNASGHRSWGRARRRPARTGSGPGPCGGSPPSATVHRGRPPKKRTATPRSESRSFSSGVLLSRRPEARSSVPTAMTAAPGGGPSPLVRRPAPDGPPHPLAGRAGHSRRKSRPAPPPAAPAFRCPGRAGGRCARRHRRPGRRP